MIHQNNWYLSTWIPHYTPPVMTLTTWQTRGIQTIISSTGWYPNVYCNKVADLNLRTFQVIFPVIHSQLVWLWMFVKISEILRLSLAWYSYIVIVTYYNHHEWDTPIYLSTWLQGLVIVTSIFQFQCNECPASSWKLSTFRYWTDRLMAINVIICHWIT